MATSRRYRVEQVFRLTLQRTASKLRGGNGESSDGLDAQLGRDRCHDAFREWQSKCLDDEPPWVFLVLLGQKCTLGCNTMGFGT